MHPRFYTILTVAILLTSCGQNKNLSTGLPTSNTPSVAPIDADIKPYTDAFVSYYKEYKGADISISFPISFQSLGYTNQEGGTNGVCRTKGGVAVSVSLDPVFWSVASDYEKEVLVFHELGHCILFRDHTTQLDADGDPVSIMFPYTLDKLTFINKFGSYIDELFLQKSSSGNHDEIVSYYSQYYPGIGFFCE